MRLSLLLTNWLVLRRCATSAAAWWRAPAGAAAPTDCSAWPRTRTSSSATRSRPADSGTYISSNFKFGRPHAFIYQTKVANLVPFQYGKLGEKEHKMSIRYLCFHLWLSPPLRLKSFLRPSSSMVSCKPWRLFASLFDNVMLEWRESFWFCMH